MVSVCHYGYLYFFFKQKTAYEWRISDWSSDVCSSDLALNVGYVLRRRQVVDDGIEQRLHALVLEGGAKQHWDEGVGDRTLADTASQRLDIRLVALEIGLHRRIVLLDGALDELGSVFRGLLGEIRGDVALDELRAARLDLPDERLHEH